MVGKILLTVGLLAACVSYCASAEVYVQKSFPQPLGPCQTFDPQGSTHEVGLHTYDIIEKYTINGQVVTSEFYVKRMDNSADRYYVVTLNGTRTGRTATLKTKDNITIYREQRPTRGWGRTVRIVCATNTREIDSITKAALAKHCNFSGMKNNVNTNC